MSALAVSALLLYCSCAALTADLCIVSSCLDLMFDNSVIGHLLIHFPGKHQEHVDGAVREAQQRLYDESRNRNGLDDTDWMSWSVKESCHLRLHHLPCSRELCKPTVTSIRASDINRLLSVSGTVIRTGVVKLLHSRREYVCAKCRHRFYVEVDIEQRHTMQVPLECPSEGLAAKHCNGIKFEQVAGTEVCRDYQEVRIQEQVHRLTVGSIPRSITLSE